MGTADTGLNSINRPSNLPGHTSPTAHVSHITAVNGEKTEMNSIVMLHKFSLFYSDVRLIVTENVTIIHVQNKF